MTEFRLPKNSRSQQQTVACTRHPTAPARCGPFASIASIRRANETPRIDTFELDVKSCGPMVLDASDPD